MNLIFVGGQSGQYLYLGIFMSLIIILGVVLFMVPSPKLETVVGSKNELIQFICIIRSIKIILEVCYKL